MGKVQRFIIIAGLLTGQVVAGAAGQTTRPAAVKKARDTRPVLVCFGDSLTAGYGAEPGHSYPDYLQKDLDQLSLGYRVVNEGVGGNTTKDGVSRLNEVLAVKPQIAVVEFGGNGPCACPDAGLLRDFDETAACISIQEAARHRRNK